MFSGKRAAVVLLCGCLSAGSLCGCSYTENQALVKIDGGKDKITYGYANFDAKLTQAMYDILYSSSGSSESVKTMWSQTVSGGDDTMENATKDEILKGMKTAYYLRKNAKKYGVTMSSADKKKIEKAAKAFMKANSKKAIKQMGATQEYAEEYLTNEYYTEKVREAIEAQADTTVSDEDANMKTIEYVFYSTQASTSSDGTVNVPSDQDLANYKSAAEALSSATDFDAEVTSTGSTVHSYSYDKDDFAKAKKDGKAKDEESNEIPYEVLEAADKLSDGQTTSVIEVKNDGYYVAHMKATTDEEQTSSNKETLASEKKTSYYNKTLKELEAKSTWKVNKRLWKKVRFIDRFKGSLIKTGK